MMNQSGSGWKKSRRNAAVWAAERALPVLLAGLSWMPVPGRAEPAPVRLEVGGDAFQHWSGLAQAARGVATLSAAGEAEFRVPDGARGQYKHGFRVYTDSAEEWQDFYGVRFEMELPDARAVDLTVSIQRAPRGPVVEAPVTSALSLCGKGWHTVTLPWPAFDFNQAGPAFLKSVKEFKLAVHPPDGSALGKVRLRRVAVVKAPGVSLECDVRGRAGEAGQTVEYQVQAGNGTEVPQAVALSFVHYGWEEMTATVEPKSFILAPGESRAATVRVQISNRIPPGGHEEQVLQAIANGDAATAGTLTFITAGAVPHPFILHTAAGWQEVRDKVAKYAWAKEQLADLVRKADAWQVPDLAKPPGNDPDDTYGPFLFRTQVENDLLAAAYAWQIAGHKEHAEKAALFLRRLSDPVAGYPVTLRACNQSLVQEGHFFQHVAMAYDMIQDANVLSAQDRRQIEGTFRMFQETIARASDYGSINNWNLSEDCGAFYCSLAMEDLAAADRWFSGPSGIRDQLAKGTMDDGWWYECSISYNLWCASEFTQAGLAYAPFGVDFLDMKVPASYSPKVMLATELSGGVTVGGADPEERRKPFGMNADIFGPTRRPYREIRDLWNGLLPFLDWRGVMFGVNDSTENKVTGNRTEVGGQPFEIAYYAFHDPAYAAVIKLGGGQRDLLYAVPVLPDKTPEQFREDAYADNVGLVMLRSQTPDRPVRGQIQAALHYGTHGWAHGHYDRTDLLSLMRYGRSFWNPESVFWVYEPFMYKFYCQTSLNHNLVVVDEKMQEATAGERLLYHPGKMMQATVVQDEARWSNPPYGGMVYDYVPVKTFAEKCWREGRSVPIPTNPPAYGTLTGYTEKILQRRALIVLDDYILLADYVKGTNAHVFESLLQIKGFQGLDAPQKQFLRHDAQWNPDPVGSGQFVTDCNWYSVTAPAVGHSAMSYGANADNAGSRSPGNEDGSLKLDVHTLWPPAQEIMVATAPEMSDVSKRLFYTVRGDGQTLAEGKFGAWILGRGEVDVSVAGMKQLELETKTELARQPTLFWVNARIITQDGKEIPLAGLAAKYENVEQPKTPGKDYFGGPIKIAGDEYTSGTPAEPRDEKLPGLVKVDLTGLQAVRFKAVIGGDYPLGNEAQRRKVYAIRAAQGSEARFLTVIEPYEDRPVVKSAVATSADSVRVELLDGRIQEITLRNFTGSGQDMQAEVVESKDGQILRRESTQDSEAGQPGARGKNGD
jgi:hypothetical protein